MVAVSIIEDHEFLQQLKRLVGCDHRVRLNSHLSATEGGGIVGEESTVHVISMLSFSWVRRMVHT
jgi:hypothetical protein